MEVEKDVKFYERSRRPSAQKLHVTSERGERGELVSPVPRFKNGIFFIKGASKRRTDRFVKLWSREEQI